MTSPFQFERIPVEEIERLAARHGRVVSDLARCSREMAEGKTPADSKRLDALALLARCTRTLLDGVVFDAEMDQLTIQEIQEVESHGHQKSPDRAAGISGRTPAH